MMVATRCGGFYQLHDFGKGLGNFTEHKAVKGFDGHISRPLEESALWIPNTEKNDWGIGVGSMFCSKKTWSRLPMGMWFILLGTECCVGWVFI